MAKRFTDSDKWRKPWFRALVRDAKLVWGYLTDNCDHAGVWPASFDLLSSDIGFEVTEELLGTWFGDKVVRIDSTKFFIPGYIEFQYGELKEDSKPHMSVIRILEKNGIDPKKLTLCKGYRSSSHTAKDKNKNKAKAKDQTKEGESEGIFLALAKKYRETFPGATTGPKAHERFKEQCADPKAIKDLEDSMAHYRLCLNAQPWRAAKTTFETYLGTESSGYFWHDYIEMPELPPAPKSNSLVDLDLTEKEGA